MRFKEYYNLNTASNKNLFEEVFEKYYTKGCFGSIDKNTIKEQQFSWFNKFNIILEQKDIGMILTALNNRDNVCTREWFSKMYNVDILESSKEEIKKIVSRLIED